MRVLTAALVTAALACAASIAAAAQSAAQTLVVDGRARTYLLHRPASAPANALRALVVVLHGGFGSASHAEEKYRWDALADREGFLVAYPDGEHRAWNAGGDCCGRPSHDHIDDLGFLSALIGALVQNERIDPARVYLAGISNGAALALDYACSGTRPEIAAIGSVAGGISAPCEHPAPVSLLEIHGMDDRNIPLVGGAGTKGVSGVSWMPVIEAIDRFRAAAACGAPAVEIRGEVTSRMSTCAGGRSVGLVTVANAGHQWPGSGDNGIVGRAMGLDPPSAALDATAVLWDFFRAHPLQGRN